MGKIDSINYDTVKALFETLVEAYGTEREALKQIENNLSLALLDAIQVTNDKVNLAKEANKNFDTFVLIMYEEIKHGKIRKMHEKMKTDHVINTPDCTLPSYRQRFEDYI